MLRTTGLCGLRPVPPAASRPFGFNPSRLRACGAARFACLQGKALRAIPAAQSLAPLDTPNRLSRIGHASASALWPVTLFRHSLQLLAHLRQQLIDLLQVVAGIGQRSSVSGCTSMTSHSSASLFKVGLLRSRSSVLM